MSLLDVPFSHGTLGMNCERANAFSDEDIEILQRFADVLTEGYQRSL